MTRLVAGAIALVLLLGVVGAVRLSSGGVAAHVAALTGIDIGDPEIVGEAPATPTPAPVEVRVRVRDMSGRPVAGAPIDAQDRFGRALAQGVVTDAGGEARFAAPPTEGATVRARKPGVGQARANGLAIARTSGGQAHVEVNLVLASGPVELPSPAAAGEGLRGGDDLPTPTTSPGQAIPAATRIATPQLLGPSPVTGAPPAPAAATAPVAGPIRPGTESVAPLRPPQLLGPSVPRRLFVGHLAPRVSAIDVASATTVGATIDLGGGRFTHVAAAASGRRLFASWGGSGDVVRLRASDLGEEGRLALGAGTVAALATNPVDGNLWVATAGAEGQDYSNVIEVDADGLKVLRRLDFNRRTGTLRFTTDGTVLGVAHRATSEVSFVDLSSGAIGKPVHVPVWPGDFQFADGGATILVSNQATSVVYAVDRGTGTAHRTYDAGSPVTSLAVVPGANRFLVANGQLGMLQAIDLSSGDVRDVVPVGQQPQAIIVDGSRRAYVANSASGTVSVIDLDSMVVSDTIVIGPGATTLALSPGTAGTRPTAGR